MSKILCQLLKPQDAQQLAEFEAQARQTEPGVLFGEIDVEQYKRKTLERMSDSRYANSKVLAAFQGGKIIARLDFSLIASLMDGECQAYVDWLYVLKPYRRCGAAKELFAFLERWLSENGVNSYFLVTAHNEEAQGFYCSLEGVQKDSDWILRKNIK